MINHLDKTIENLLTQEIDIGNGDVEVSFNAPNGEWANRAVSRPTLNFFLYDVRENAPLRKHQWQQLTTRPTPVNGSGLNGHGSNGNGRKKKGPEPPEDLRRLSSAHLKRTPLMVDCFYMVTAWSPSDDRYQPTDEHRLLSLCMMALARYPVLNPEQIPVEEMARRTGRSPDPEGRQQATEYLAGALANQDIEIRTRLAYHDVLTNPAEVWSALENQMKAAFSYVVTLPLDPWDKSVQIAEQVGAAEFRTGQSLPPVPDPEDEGIDLDPEERTINDGFSQSLYRVAGTIWNTAEEELEPAVALNVSIIEPDLLDGKKNLGLYRRTKSDRQGRFSFQRLMPGEYVVVVGPDWEEPLATENIVIRSSKEEVPEERENILIDFEVKLPKQEEEE